MATLIKADGTCLEDFDCVSLWQKQNAVGGSIEIVPTKNENLLIVNQDGVITGLPFNSKASSLAGQKIVGDVIEISRDELSDHAGVDIDDYY